MRNYKMLRRALVAAVLLPTMLVSGVALAERPYVAIEQRLSAEQIHATGLDQLSPAQLSLLNQLLREEQTNVAAPQPNASVEDAKQKRRWSAP